ncbi:hypothetical protein DMN91_006700 [Ooceraea biroi]|uniref:UBX domain-containing protein 4 n=1 Tax=Ooceraea biroi TaxID=2015173 RepID=A0A026W8N1_OOCBI|nr:UBX domain-containing protein 4 [Ooceraea biroi]EZA52333.1 UBX domain-containing protein [Ooceraea biroi]RLU20094.1 hypothetical protein DMN91_006700 [Ooceraea biroi]
MKWFVGSINEAVATSKSRKAVFVVFVEGKDDTSVQLAQTIDTAEISSLLEEEHFVAIRLESGSEAYRFFAQIYQLVPVPSLFFIGENGTPLEIVAGNTTATELVSKINNVLLKAGKTNKNFLSILVDEEERMREASTSSSSNNNATEATASNINNVGPNPNTGLTSTVESVTTSSSNDEKGLTGGAVKTATSSNTENQNNNEASKNDSETMQENQDVELTAEEKMERARQLIMLQRKQRLEEEQKKEREREIERRQMGRDVQKMRQMQQELQIKQAQEERMREKAAEAAAREKVRQQIAQDKLERKQKELALQQQQQQVQQKQSQKQLKHSLPSSAATVTRIQFRLPSGNSYTGQFEPTSTLRALRTYVIENIELPFRQFVMSTSFPRRELTNEENDKTLLELELVPTAVILILPLKTSNVTKAVTSTTQDVGFFSRLIWSFFTPVIHIYNYIIDYFSGANRETNRDNSNNDSTEVVNEPERDISPNRGNVVQPSGLLRRYLSNQGGATIRAQGNVHRLHSGGDDNDENNTWNGNSTQQM